MEQPLPDKRRSMLRAKVRIRPTGMAVDECSSRKINTIVSPQL
jgi:hypothetical protein